ncbi:biopterin transporter,putative;with=GeneDB:LinJ35_V3.5120 [Leishmania major strain Friedlin]|uniref:Biopterin transporter BT1 n=1 Tax=Leishmania major TaxID=5664 RepID=Q7KIP2_LEIMA|nr:biopterin transporter,putative;with=GeneDB:LinJ35_V3.5120 [Leishmania major strain Friedlin]AAF64060.1 biopterin transporter BT1 [Leishmania major]CAG9582871.1 pteridine_transporter_(truncated)_-_putative [Leishmania major strain Friedlin]CBZ13143.1 biopterin transporter,putative;with=GeneDB:LinJ35_V3.5120 [Leishmania major strain Friedlin]|eukprot:XP_003722908.1 biopterin transporter,putative;with=GeneDB:LinJ35_V3.5120 [Leishmania major strain Friedlin]
MPGRYRVPSAPESPPPQGAKYVHPVSAHVLRAAPFLGYIPVFSIVIRSFHPKVVLAICIQRLFEKGLADGLMRLSIQPMLTGRYGLTGAMYQRLSTLYTLGWALNAFITVMADTFALFGYTKRWYCVMSAVGGSVFALLYGLLPAKESSAKPAAALMFLTALFMSNIDVFAVALYSEQIRRRPAAGPALVSWMWGTALIGIMISSVILGPLSDNGLAHFGVYITAAILLLSGLLFVFNLFEERRNRAARLEDAMIEFLQKTKSASSESTAGSPPSPHKLDGHLTIDNRVEEEDDNVDEQEAAAMDAQGFVRPRMDTYLCGAVEMNRDVILRNWRMALFCLILTLGVIANSLVSILGTWWDIMYVCIVLAAVLCVSSFFTLPLAIAKAVVFMYFNAILYLSLPGVLNTFYVAKPSCLPDGPHFSYTFYNAMNGFLGNIAGIGGTIVFTHLFPHHSYRFVMGLSAVLLPAASMFDVLILKRWNLAIGIPDHAMYIFGDTIIYEVCNMLLNMPMMMLMCRIAPRGSESMVFALLASIYHLGTSTSSAIGYLLMETIWPVVTQGQCDYSNALWLVITGHIVTPVFILPLAYILLPSARISDHIDHTGRKVMEVALPETRTEEAEEPIAMTTRRDS